MFRCSLEESKEQVLSDIFCYSDKEMLFASLLGRHDDIKNFTKKMMRNKAINLESKKYKVSGEVVDVFSSKIQGSDLSHALFYKKDTVGVDSDGDQQLEVYVYLHGDPNKYGLQNNISRTAPVSQYQVAAEVYDCLHKKLNKLTTYPVLREWIPYLLYQLYKQRHVSYAQMFKENKDEPVNVIIIKCKVQKLIDYISSGLKNKVITINGCSERSNKMQAIAGLDSYLNSHSEILAEKIQASFKPRFDSKNDSYARKLDLFTEYVRAKAGLELFDAQKAVMQSSFATLQDKRSNFIVGSMGSGKTVMALGVLFTLAKKLTKNIILCPSHLVHKWRNEIMTQVPLSEAIIVEDFNHLRTLEANIRKHHNRNLFLIIPKDTAKLGYDERPVVSWSEKKSCYVCPECGQPVFKKEWIGSGIDRERIEVPLTEQDFLKQYAYNYVCPNKVSKWDKKTLKEVDVDCRTKLWGPVGSTKDQEWVKLGQYGWVEKKRARYLYTQLLSKSFKKRDEISLVTALSDYFENPAAFTQRAPRKYPISRYIRKKLKGVFDYFIADELHEYKAGDSAQAQAFADLYSATKKTIGLTGTLVNGYASGIYYLLYRAFPHLMVKEGYKYSSTNLFSAHYGVARKSELFTFRKDKSRKKISSTLKELPGISPIVFSKFLLENAVFIDLADMAEGLPNYAEIPIGIDMDEELAEAYKNLEEEIRKNCAGIGKRGFKAMGPAIQLLSSFPDMPYDNAPLFHPDNGDVLIEPPSLVKRPRNKDAVLMDIVKKKVANGEKVLIYGHWSKKTDVMSRLPEMFNHENIKCKALTTKVKAKDRENWIYDQVQSGVDVLVCNPALVKTGLDLLDFTCIIFYQTGYNLYTLRQASRRSWRLSQENDVEVYFLYYKETVQEQALALMATKLQAAMTVEGKFSEEGLSALSNNQDILSQLANSVVQGMRYSLDVDTFKKVSVKNDKQRTKLLKKRKLAMANRRNKAQNPPFVHYNRKNSVPVKYLHQILSEMGHLSGLA